MRKWLFSLLILVSPSLLMAQSQFGNDFVLSGATCPPVNTPAHTGTLYTCTGTGALYTWTGSAWVLTGGGSSTLTGTIANTQVAYGSGANAIQGRSTLTVTDQGFLVGPSNPTGNNYYGMLMVSDSLSISLGLVSVSNTNYSDIDFYRYRGTVGTPTIAQVGDKLGLTTYNTTSGGPVDVQVVVTDVSAGVAVATYQMNVQGKEPGGYYPYVWLNADTGIVSYSDGPPDTDSPGLLGGLAGAPLKVMTKDGTRLADFTARNVVVSELDTDTTSGHTALIQAYDNNTGPAYVTFATLTNGNTPSLVVSPPAGGATVSLTANAFATSSTTAVAVANVGANSCGTSAASIAGNDNVGAITVGATSATQCRITFTVAATTRRHCVATDETTAGVAASLHTAYVDSTHTDILGTITAADVISYVCFAR